MAPRRRFGHHGAPGYRLIANVDQGKAAFRLADPVGFPTDLAVKIYGEPKPGPAIVCKLYGASTYNCARLWVDQRFRV